MGQKRDELLKRIQKLVRKNQELYDKNDKLQKAHIELSEQADMIKIELKESRAEAKEGSAPEAVERIKKYKMATVLFAYITGFKHLTDNDSSELVMDQLDEVLSGEDQNAFWRDQWHETVECLLQQRTFTE